MPRKAFVLWLGDKEDKKWRSRYKRERKVIARFYWWLRANPRVGCARLAHRHGWVTTAAGAKSKLKILGDT